MLVGVVFVNRAAAGDLLVIEVVPDLKLAGADLHGAVERLGEAEVVFLEGDRVSRRGHRGKGDTLRPHQHPVAQQAGDGETLRRCGGLAGPDAGRRAEIYSQVLGVREEQPPPVRRHSRLHKRVRILVDRQGLVVVRGVHRQGQGYLLHIREAGGGARLVAGLGKYGKENRCQDRNNCNYDEKLDQCESAAHRSSSPEHGEWTTTLQPVVLLLLPTLRVECLPTVGGYHSSSPLATSPQGRNCAWRDESWE